MGAINGILEFRNREQEIQRLLDRLPPQSLIPSLTFVRAPAGFGKSRLVDEVLQNLEQSQLLCCVVEPDVRATERSNRVYSWFFVQRAAAPTAIRDLSHSMSFAEYLRASPTRRINWKHVYETGKEALSLAKLGRIGVELVENWFGKNRFHPDALLRDDSPFATRLAKEYLEYLCQTKPILFVIRETQLIDVESLRFFLSLHKGSQSVHVIFEYTHPGSRFYTEHEKIIGDSLSPDANIHIIDLVRLDQVQLIYLLRKYVAEDFDLRSDLVLRWDGNLRLIRELKFRTSVSENNPLQRAWSHSNLRQLIIEHVYGLPALAKFILATVVSHVEALPVEILHATAEKAAMAADSTHVISGLAEMVANSHYIVVRHSRLAVVDEDVQSVVAEDESFARFRALAEHSLRDVYLELVSGQRRSNIPLPLAFRQAVALCVRTGDIVALRRLLQILDDGARDAHDQNLYISMVADAVIRQDDLNHAEQASLVEWAAGAAYEISDFGLAAQLIEMLPDQSLYHKCLLAFSYQELNKHQTALEIADDLAEGPSGPGIELTAQLIRVVTLYAISQKLAAEKLHQQLRQTSGYQEQPLYGFVLRFTELFVDFPDCVDDLRQSIAHFQRHGLRASAAYSSLAAAMHLAYGGQILDARSMLAEAKNELSTKVRDQHILLNNEVVIDLLSEKPDLDDCLRKLEDCAYTVRDDFYRLVIENNRLICHGLKEHRKEGYDRIAQIEKIIAAPQFGNKDIFWTVTYNVWRFLKDSGDGGGAQAWYDRLSSIRVESLNYADLWPFRFGIAPSVDPKYSHLLKCRYHPEFLSHWLVDLEALSDLKAR